MIGIFSPARLGISKETIKPSPKSLRRIMLWTRMIPLPASADDAQGHCGVQGRPFATTELPLSHVPGAAEDSTASRSLECRTMSSTTSRFAAMVCRRLSAFLFEDQASGC